MLAFATELPIKPQTTAADFLLAVQQWLLGSPHTVFSEDDVRDLASASEWRLRKTNELVETLKFESGSADSAAVRYTRLEGGLEWISEVTYSRGPLATWVAVRTSCESQHPSARLPVAKKPVILRTILQRLGGGEDGGLLVASAPKMLSNSEIDLASRCLRGTAGCRLPVVYVSSLFHAGHAVDPRKLADSLSGMAHVLVEPNRPFSIRLMQEVDGENVYGGTIGVYWPEGSGRRSFFLGKQYDSAADLEKAIFEEIRTALTNRRPLRGTTWSAVQEQIARQQLSELRDAGSAELNRYADTFDKELLARQQAHDDAEREIARLQAEIRRYQAQNPMQSGLVVKTAPEQDLFPGEILGIVRDALSDAATRVPEDSRRQHVLQGIVSANPATGEAEAMRTRLKTLLRDFRSMDHKLKSALQDLGFGIADDGKHTKLVFQGDDRYTFAVPKSGSDYRGGLNLASDISRLLL